MNLILFKEDENLGFLKIDVFRTKHILGIIKSSLGDSLDIGVINGKIGKLLITKIDETGITFNYDLNEEPPELLPITFIIGTPRPPVAKRLLKDLSTSGAEKIIMCATDLGEKTYLTSKLWTNEKYMEYVYDGGSQAESTLTPVIERYFSLKKAISSIPEDYDRLALDNISPDFKISSYKPINKKVVVCIGGERGFSDREREMLRDSGFSIFSLGNRVLRTETVCHAVLGSLLTTKGLI